MNRSRIETLLLTLVFSSVLAAENGSLEQKSWTIEGVKRDATIYVPTTATSADTPVIFDFHGHGGTGKFAALGHNFQKHWSEAICVYMQGLPTAGKTDPEGLKPGWQMRPGDSNDRDLKFFDAVLASLKKDYKVDIAHIYCTGHSNGAVFTYNLWRARGETFAAVAPVAGVTLIGFKDFKPLPLLHIAGEKDPIVPFKAQQLTIDGAKKVNGCDTEGKPWTTAGPLVARAFQLSFRCIGQKNAKAAKGSAMKRLNASGMNLCRVRRRISPITRLRSAERFWGACPDRTRQASSPMLTSRT